MPLQLAPVIYFPSPITRMTTQARREPVERWSSVRQVDEITPFPGALDGPLRYKAPEGVHPSITGPRLRGAPFAADDSRSVTATHRSRAVVRMPNCCDVL